MPASWNSSVFTTLVMLAARPAATAPSPADRSAPAALFAAKCSSCHTFGRGALVGPDLEGVNARYPRAWLIAWIRSSETLIRSGDARARALFLRYRQQRMPDHELSDAQIEALLDYLAAGGPALQTPAPTRHARTATSGEVALGEQLFYGRVGLANGGAACAACHAVGGASGLGTLGADLSGAYSKYQDRGLSALLERTCFPRAPSAAGRASVTPEEAFALKAFLQRADAARRER